MFEPKVQTDRVFKLFKKRLADETAASLLGHLKTMARYFGEFTLPSTIPEAAVRDVIEDVNDLRGRNDIRRTAPCEGGAAGTARILCSPRSANRSPCIPVDNDRREERPAAGNNLPTGGFRIHQDGS